jgi:hypothetical protein
MSKLMGPPDPLLEGGRRDARTAGDHFTRNRHADISRRRQPIQAGSIAPNHDLAGSPVDVLQARRDHFAGAKTQPGQQHQHRGAPPATGAPAVTATHKRLDCRGFDRLGQTRQPPRGHFRHCINQRAGCHARVVGRYD